MPKVQTLPSKSSSTYQNTLSTSSILREQQIRPRRGVTKPLRQKVLGQSFQVQVAVLLLDAGLGLVSLDHVAHSGLRLVLADVSGLTDAAGTAGPTKAVDFLQQVLEALVALTPLTSKFGLYRAFLHEYQSSAQGSMGVLVKRLAGVAQQQQLQRQAEELEKKDRQLQEQTSKLDAMTADRDKWMIHSQGLLVSCRT